MKKKIWILLIVALSISVVFNLYFFGWKALKAHELKMQQKGFNVAVSMVIAKVQKDGEVVINTENGQLVLVIKPEQKIQEK